MVVIIVITVKLIHHFLLGITNHCRNGVDKSEFTVGPGNKTIISGQQAKEQFGTILLPLGWLGALRRGDVGQVGTTGSDSRVDLVRVCLPKPWLTHAEQCDQ